MDRILVFFTSGYGATRQYAEWLEADVECEVRQMEEGLPENIENYSKVLIAGGIYAGKFAGLDFMKKYADQLGKMEVAVLAVGAENLHKGLTEKIWLQNFKDLELDVEVFYARGEFDFRNMKFSDKMMVRIGYMIYKKKLSENPEQYKIMGDRKTAYDWKDENYLKPVVKWLEVRE